MSTDTIFLHHFIDYYADWPVPGTTFRDLTRLYQSAEAMHAVVARLKGRYLSRDITHIAAIEARGFLLGGMLAASLNLPLIVIRKGEKMAGDPLTHQVDMSYGRRQLQVRKEACPSGARVVIFDDLIATGSSVLGASLLLKEMGIIVEEIATVAEVPSEGCRERIGNADISLYALVAFDQS